MFSFLTLLFVDEDCSLVPFGACSAPCELSGASFSATGRSGRWFTCSVGVIDPEELLSRSISANFTLLSSTGSSHKFMPQ